MAAVCLAECEDVADVAIVAVENNAQPGGMELGVAAPPTP